MRLTTVAAALAAVSLSSAFSPAFADVVDNWQMGVNTSNAGNTHAEVQRFLTTLEPEARRAVIDGCRHYLTHPEDAQTAGRSAAHSERTLKFCSWPSNGQIRR